MEARSCRLSIALHPESRGTEPRNTTDDSGQSFELPPNREGFASAAISADQANERLAASGPGPFPRGESRAKRKATSGTDDLRTSTKNEISLREEDWVCHAKVGWR